uniref:(S)-2-hydroxy-acid oxidase n=1 Tax=Cannabis sativa TaxID=3483 RepID=A0A803NYD4_CANSA
MAPEPVNVNEFKELARQALPKMYFDYYAGGAEDENTLRENIEAYQRIRLRPRVLVDVSRIDMSTTVLGYKISAPIMIAPTAYHQLAHPEGEVATARAAASCDTIMVLSYMSNCAVEEVASSCNAVRFYQLYVNKRRDVSAQLVQRAERNGFKAIVWTVDAPRLGRREADIRNKMVAPQLKNFEGLMSAEVHTLRGDDGSKLEAFARKTFDDSLCWEDLKWLRSITNLPILIKGVLTHEDARKAVEAGVHGIVVSNHGARQLDHTPATISVLEEVVQAVGGKVPVIVDGGIRRGTDVFKALALGAQAVLIGRPVIYGLAAMGQRGVKSVVEMLKNELELTMALSGCPTLEHITRSHAKMASEPVNVNEFQELARKVLPKMYFDFYNGGAEDEYTLKQNMEAFQRIRLWPRVLVDVSRIDMSTTLLGYKIAAPILIAPTAMHQLAHPEGEKATARAAASCNTIMVVSFSSNCTIEEVASSCNAVRFFQLYVYKQREVSAELVKRAERNGFKAIVLTADTPKLGRREADIKNKMIAPKIRNLEGLMATEVDSNDGSNLEAYASKTMDASLCWKDIEWLRSITSLPILVKGVLTHEDARMAVEAGLDGIIVSNHGGRQLDYAPPTISVLEEVIHGVGGKIPVLLDGGVRRGTDVFKALALGAQAVLVGRPVIYGLAAKGENGVRTVIEMLKNELELTMTLSGCPTLKDIHRSHVMTSQESLHSKL